MIARIFIEVGLLVGGVTLLGVLIGRLVHGKMTKEE